MSSEFRQYLYDHDHPRLAALRGMDAYDYQRAARERGTFTGELIAGWTPLYRNSFRGITEDGRIRTDVHRWQPARSDEHAPTADMAAAAQTLLDLLADEARRRLTHPVDAVEWQTWSNPEFLQFDTGLRLERQPAQVRAAVLALVEASLSPRGYNDARAMMRINGFLGELVGLPKILNEFSYNVALFGEPDVEGPWGWQLFGHHLALNCFVIEGRMVLSPVFLGAEPNEIDEGPHIGVGHEVFAARKEFATALMASLPTEQRQQATVFSSLNDPSMPPGRIHPGDERHLAGAFQDNRRIAFEGLPVSEMNADSQALVWAIIDEFLSLMPEGPRSATARQIRSYRAETWFCWIGGHQDGDVFYFRIQSPAIIVELDHHRGVFLDNDTPQPFHIHTVMRTPHGNDYGRAFLRQWRERRR